jgi:hypothetical protein
MRPSQAEEVSKITSTVYTNDTAEAYPNLNANFVTAKLRLTCETVYQGFVL